ncbi:MAG: methionyl-tRNA formyltransferase [Chloroflexi bacterium]|nr:methionyl-tRNA formyltransferase [Chloroflexota bacterium]
MGTAAFAVPSLRAVAAAPWAQLVGVITQPSRPAGRGRAVQPSPVRLAADELGLPVLTPERLRRPAAVEAYQALRPDLCVVAAYGQILSPAVLAVPPRGSLNVHASLLPRHRGAAPVAGALLAGDRETGVTIMLMDAGLDTGPVLTTIVETIRSDDTTASLTVRLADLGAQLLAQTTPAWLAGTLSPQPQDEARATLTRPVRKEDGRIDWRLPAEQIERHVRAYHPWPAAFTVDASGERLVIQAARALPAGALAPGAGGTVAGRPAIGAGAGALEPVLVQPAGRRPMPYADYLRGRHLTPEQAQFQ